jgi:hypothetical protein
MTREKRKEEMSAVSDQWHCGEIISGQKLTSRVLVVSGCGALIAPNNKFYNMRPVQKVFDFIFSRKNQ